MHWETSLLHVARSQGGAVGIHQLGPNGCRGQHWRSAVESGRWVRLSRRVIRLIGAPDSDELRAHAAILDAGRHGVLHGPSTLAWCGLRGFDLATVHVVRHRGTTTSGCDLARVHRVRDLHDHDITSIRGVRTVTPIRAIWSEASRYSGPRSHERGVQRIGRLLDDANGLKLVTWDELAHSVDALAERGRAGSRIMRAVSAARPTGSMPTESRNEDRLEEVLRDSKCRALVRQPVVGGRRPIGRTDFRDRTLPMVVEVNSLRFHSAPSDVQADVARYRRLLDAGFVVVVIWEDALWSDVRSVVAAVQLGRWHAQQGECVEIHTTGCPWPQDPSRIEAGPEAPPYRG